MEDTSTPTFILSLSEKLFCNFVLSAKVALSGVSERVPLNDAGHY